MRKPMLVARARKAASEASPRRLREGSATAWIVIGAGCFGINKKRSLVAAAGSFVPCCYGLGENANGAEPDEVCAVVFTLYIQNSKLGGVIWTFWEFYILC